MPVSVPDEEGEAMTSEEWNRCRDPAKMLQFLRGKASDRKLRLLACACCRRAWDFLQTSESRHAILVAERYADGLATTGELATARCHAARPARDAAARHISTTPGAAGKAAAARFGSNAYRRIYGAYAEPLRRGAPRTAARELGLSPEAALDPRDAYLEAEAREAAEQADLLREVFGNPFRPLPIFGPTVLAYHGGAARQLAESIYESRAFQDLPVLADLLEEAGLTDAGLLGHLRGPGPHVLGCHALDAVLNKS
jgi:hypothetical protein